MSVSSLRGRCCNVHPLLKSINKVSPQLSDCTKQQHVRHFSTCAQCWRSDFAGTDKEPHQVTERLFDHSSPNWATTNCSTFQQGKSNLKIHVGVEVTRTRSEEEEEPQRHDSRLRGGPGWARRRRYGAKKNNWWWITTMCVLLNVCTHSCPAGQHKEEVQHTSVSGLASYFGEEDKPHDTRTLYFSFCVTALKVGKKLIMPGNLKYNLVEAVLCFFF